MTCRCEETSQLGPGVLGGSDKRELDGGGLCVGVRTMLMMALMAGIAVVIAFNTITVGDG